MTHPASARGRRPVLSKRSAALVAKKSGRAVEYLLARGTLPILYWLKKDILSVSCEREFRNLEKYAERIRILESQTPNGGWSLKKAGGPAPALGTRHFFETIRNGLRLYDFGCDADHSAIRRAVEFVLSTQNRQGLLGAGEAGEPSLTAHALALEFLCRFGLDGDERVRKGFRWLMKTQQPDGGWRVSSGPAETTGSPRRGARRLPSSSRATGIVLGALAESPHWQKSRQARRAGEWIQGRFFREGERSAAEGSCRWGAIGYPFWSTHILSCLDALSRMGFRPDSAGIRMGLEWLFRRQHAAGYWEAHQTKPGGDDHLWVTLAVLRVIKGFGLISV